jgi:NADH-quinone oxidoreductase subunit L
MNSSITVAAIALLSPAVAAVLMLLLPRARKLGKPAAAATILGSLASLGASTKLLFDRLGGAPDARWTFSWLFAGAKPIAEGGLNVDGTSVIMLFVVCLVALCVQVFSVSYMHDEPAPAFGRYFTLHALFLFSMNSLVLAPNLLQLFAGWELVGLTSYTLIGFYFAKPSAAKAAVKAFWMTKLADMGFLFGLLILFVDQGSFDWTAAPGTLVATWVTLMLFLAVVGKSAQFPLHIWLPDAMEGPTPVSALLHAATMVAAGVFLVVRADPLFALAPATRELMLWVGAVTAVFASLLALVQRDIKKVLAYSTAAQLGYMVAALGAGATFAGFFHLSTHAFFKALLFLAAGSVIHAVHSNNLEDMGGLAKKMPITAFCFIAGALSLAGLPFVTAGFFSKDAVLTGVEGRGGWIPWALLMSSAFLTALYMGRVLLKTFFGVASQKAQHAHESDAVMTGPLLVLALPAIVAGYLGGWAAHTTGHEAETLHLGLTPVLASLMGVGGLTAAYFIYGQGKSAPLTELIARLDRASAIDRSWEFLYRHGLLALSRVLGWFDRYVVDGAMNFFGWAAIEGGQSARALQTGRIRDYVWAVAVGAIVLALIGGWR